MADEYASVRKQLRIKTGAVERLLKELNVYRGEEEDQVKRVNKLKGEGAEAADIRQAETVLREANKMVPDTQNRLAKSVADLKDLTTSIAAVEALRDDTDYAKAREALGKAEV